MAMVDFTNAQLHLPESYNPIETSWADLYAAIFRNSSDTIINKEYAATITTNEPKNIVISYAGTFKTSGTELYIAVVSDHTKDWKITGISFQANDTYSFQIPVTIV